MFIEANITIDVPDGVDMAPIIQQIKAVLSRANGMDTDVHVIEVDDPVSTNPIYISK